MTRLNKRERSIEKGRGWKRYPAVEHLKDER